MKPRQNTLKRTSKSKRRVKIILKSRTNILKLFKNIEIIERMIGYFYIIVAFESAFIDLFFMSVFDSGRYDGVG